MSNDNDVVNEWLLQRIITLQIENDKLQDEIERLEREAKDLTEQILAAMTASKAIDQSPYVEAYPYPPVPSWIPGFDKPWTPAEIIC